VDAYLAHRAGELNLPVEQPTGPLLAPAHGHRLYQAAL